MTDTALQERLRDHAKAFDGLLSLIPAKMYYGEDTSDQWRKKKQTKDQARAAKRGKLDPDSELNRNAKEVLDERARNKRKLQEMEADEESETGSDEGDESDISGIEKEKPGEGLKKKLKLDEEEEDAKPKKEKKVVEETEQAKSEDSLGKKQKAKEEKKLAKKQKKEEDKRLKKEGAKKERKSEKAETKEPAVDKEDAESGAEESEAEDGPVHPSTEADNNDGDMAPIDVSGLINDDDGPAGSSADSEPNSPVFDTTKNASVELASTTTSISSAVPPSEKPKYLKIPADTTALRARLEAKLAALRAKRKADDPEGKPIRTRQDLIESRRQKQAQRKAHKQELRRLAKEQEEKKREEALASARDSPGLSPLFEKDDDGTPTNFAFGRLTFSDGTQLSHDLSYEKTPGGAKKGPSDPKTALAKLEAQKKRLQGMDENKRKEVLEKETWLAARRRAEGEKVHDSESLLKKALKRKEKAKKKSEREWKERAEGVTKAIQDRQRKREENLRKRRDEKAANKGGKKKNKGVQTKKKNRPGFEGGFGAGRK
ncbi:SURF6-domain-containing protein [Parathielavia appendiculata]|uniref:SURF6-domain-containing protein n=1 Tax=Parathielavia appendiculata TaxID=2587402 RepID=A0AAN6Z4J6_9PEZI|nr:SURF6-domain-containing protein [Parathielavia appendiculata]